MYKYYVLFIVYHVGGGGVKNIPALSKDMRGEISSKS
jgi:hypothetical protein